MGRNFPELLVKDLKNSASIFTSRHMTLGPPEPTLLTEEPEIHDDCPVMARSDRPPSCYQLPKLKRLSAVVPNLDPATWLFEQDIEPVSSSSSESSRSSFEMESIPTRPRQESVITNGTITSERPCMSKSNTSKSSANHDRHHRQKSWVDLDPDSTDTEASKSSSETKPSTGSSSQNATKFKKSPSLNGHGQGTRRFFALQQTRSTERRDEEPSPTRKSTTVVTSSNKKTSSSVSSRTEDISAGKGSLLSTRRASVVRTLSHIDTSLGSPKNNMEFSSPVWRSPQDSQQGPPIPLPPDVVETLTVCTSSFPETMLLCSSLSVETIRTYSRKVKRPGSPENSEARKLLLEGSTPTHPTMPPTPPQSAGFSRWRFSSMLSPMKSTASFMTSSSGNSNNNHGEQPRYSTESNPSRTGRRSSKTQVGRGSPAPAHPDFARFKSIFPGVADYLCDALYAHIVVYNYIVLFCGPATFSAKPSRVSSPRSATKTDFCPSPAPRVQSSSSSTTTNTSTTTTTPTTTNSPNNKQNHKVPKKAAHVLGIARPATTVLSSPRATDAFHAHLAEATRASLVRVSATDLEIVEVGPKKTSSSSGSGSNAQSPQKISRKQSRSEEDGAAEQDENAPLRALRDALGSCIVRLIKTMMLMSSSPSSPSCCPNDDEIDIAPEGGRVGASDPVDSLLVRTLCEMVKCCEDVD
ncbi:hypothetical protein MCOR25_006357 [Pyricularia grisea]|uniref:Uncharacterized protein n=1 Tax=Pyricularia grisea TaxID=148305 RepID=A0A6P8AZF6_PYRGI|nr:hypothetical protein PgNI_10293 [Pyricularia grisea]KAI6361934.1 hypothetical protein MCOR25_006357 [Pyricularia grisea]TLD07705.1 hypothetical protein PgNI_10293 [Pyricularia grisea]